MCTLHTMCVCGGTAAAKFQIIMIVSDPKMICSIKYHQVYVCVCAFSVPTLYRCRFFFLSNKIKSKMLTTNHAATQNTNEIKNNQEDTHFQRHEKRQRLRNFESERRRVRMCCE